MHDLSADHEVERAMKRASSTSCVVTTIVRPSLISPSRQVRTRRIGFRGGKCTSVPWYHGVPFRERRPTMTLRSRTLRLPADQAEALDVIAGVDGVSVNEEIQRAIVAHIEARRSDPDFRQRLKASIERNREILERLAR
jgi:hypothetical protein